ncbi:MAG: TVP38/TMEM64 family protein [Oryzomonas sp.]|uniref:TVP38/TMEM64 family protein n=1 Tax=Oryzomonas sp. TaxID=2855186 RepID=UPI00284C3FC1|nr:TVP38/TMEM64 family protein [Oryzomonas sp.]MDR3580254.1 TVP38/TMEM64 family protein [Oryzomonas sp.]
MPWKKILIVLAGGVAVCMFMWFDLGRFLTLEALKANRQSLVEYHAAHRAAMVAGFMAIYIAQTALSLPGAAVLSLAAGAIFGSVMGTVYANCAATIGATLAFLVTRYLLRDAIQNRFGQKLEALNSELEARGLNYLLFLRLVPLFPFFLINLAAGMTRLPLRTFVIGTMVGIIPGGFVYVNAGASLATITALSDIASPRVLGSFALLGLFALLPALYNRLKAGKTRPQQPGSR